MSNGTGYITDLGMTGVKNSILGVKSEIIINRLKNNDMSLGLVANNINANDISWALFDLKNQIYGDMTGTMNLSCNGTDFQQCMESLTGETKFNVKDGRMPKLGSLEYLLKASRLMNLR